MDDDWIERDAAVVWHGFTQMAAYPDNSPVIVERAEGHELIDTAGRRYLDAISSLWVATLGHRVPQLDAALADQLGRVAHSTMLGHGNRTVIELAEALATLVPVDRPHFLFASDGAAAVEQAIKIAFQFWVNEGVEGRTTYLAFGGAYHGDTVGSLSVGAGGFGTDLFDPLRFPVIHAPGFDDPECFDAAARIIRQKRDELAAVIVEPLVQGAAGMRIAPPEAFGPLADACRSTGLLLICDEVATGFGRTGHLFASEAATLQPDLLCLGKGMTGGYLPMSATAANRRVFDAFVGPDLSERTLYHGHSYGGNALAAAVALRHLELLQELNVLENVATRSQGLRDLLDERVRPLPGITDVRLCGLMGAVELDCADDLLRARRACNVATQNGVLVRSLGPSIIIVPPLTIGAEEVNRIVEALEKAIVEVGP
ncbi:MAG: adenosylmethionine--8-amino-7-oxononanoate transaminase [Actinomycetota bacterium]